MTLQSQIIALAAGWRALGRQDRIEALIARLTPPAKAEIARRDAHPNEAVQTPAAWQLTHILLAEGRHDEAQALGVASAAELLQDDIKRRRGVGRLPEYVAGTRTENDRVSIYVYCISESAAVRAWRDLPVCYAAQRAALTTPGQRYYTAQTSLMYAGQAATAGDVGVAREILSAALAAAGPALVAEPSLANSPDGAFDLRAVVEIAKAELRAEGRLPKNRP